MWKLGKSNAARLEDRIVELEGQNEELPKLRLERLELKEEIEQLKSRKKIEEEDIKHMVRLKEERMEVEFEKKSLQMEREKEEAINQVKEQYRDKVEKDLKTQIDRMQSMYSEVLARLPNITAKLKGEV